jgi:hypothetical protein
MKKYLLIIQIFALFISTVCHAESSEDLSGSSQETTALKAAELMSDFLRFPEIHLADAIATFDYLYTEKLLEINLKQLKRPGFKSALPNSEAFPFDQWAFEIYKALAENHRIYYYTPQWFPNAADPKPIPATLAPTTEARQVLSWLLKAALLHHKPSIHALSQIAQAQPSSNLDAIKTLWNESDEVLNKKLPPLKTFTNVMKLHSGLALSQTKNFDQYAYIAQEFIPLDDTQLLFSQYLFDVRQVDRALFGFMPIEHSFGKYLTRDQRAHRSIKKRFYTKYAMEYVRLIAHEDIVSAMRSDFINNQDMCQVYYGVNCDAIKKDGRTGVNAAEVITSAAVSEPESQFERLEHRDFQNSVYYLLVLLRQQDLLEHILQQENTHALPLAVTLYNSLLRLKTFTKKTSVYRQEGLKVLTPSTDAFPLDQWAFQIHSKLAVHFGVQYFIPSLFIDNPSVQSPVALSKLPKHKEAMLWAWFFKAALLGEPTSRQNILHATPEITRQLNRRFKALKSTQLGLPKRFDELQTLLRLQDQSVETDYKLLLYPAENQSQVFFVPNQFNSVTEPLVYLFNLGFSDQAESHPYADVEPVQIKALWEKYHAERIYKVYAEYIRSAVAAQAPDLVSSLRNTLRSGQNTAIIKECSKHLGYSCAISNIEEKLKP